MEKEWYKKSLDEIKDTFNVDFETGLTNAQVEKSRMENGLNELNAKKKKSILQKFLEQFKDFMIIVLIIAAIVSGFVSISEGEGITDTIIILIVVLLNAIIGVVQENKAEKSLEALQKLSDHASKVIRDGKMLVVPSKELVPGDVVVLDTGDYIPADLRIIEESNLKCQESALTGESVPIQKSKDVILEDVGIGDRKNILFSSSLVTYGRGKGVVVATGMNTEVGKIAKIINDTEDKQTPLQQKLNKLGKTLGITALVICVFIFVIGIIYGKEPIHMFMSAVSLAVAAIPEGLAAVSTIVLAIGVQRMVKKNAIIKKLPAVETLGSATVICSDKTGTLTQNKMTVKKICYNDNILNIDDIKNDNKKDEIEKIVFASMLCNDTKIMPDGSLNGDPTETALVDMGFKLGYTSNIYEENTRVDEIPFDSSRKLMTTVNKYNDKFIVYTKGGVDELLSRSNSYLLNGKIYKDLSEYKNNILSQNENMAKEALRVLAIGYKILDSKPTKQDMENIESNLTYVGMVGMIDPPRLEAKDAVSKCKMAGIKTVMITGDHKLTAVAIAKELGILENENEAITGADLEKITDEELTKNIRNYSVYARVSPEHKVRIVDAWQKNGEIVAMTGDGVNDAPALKKADIGCAMGNVGTDVAKEAADVILTDDNFATVVSAVEEGRRIYDNILKAIQFLISSNVGEIIVLFIAILITPLLANLFGISNVNELEPLLPIHILWINLVTDSLPALALAVDPASKDIMKRKPNKKRNSIFTKSMIWQIVYQGIMIGLITLIAFIIGLATPGYGEEERLKIGQTMAFCVLALSELVHVFNIRDNKNSIFKTGIFGNKKLILANLVSAALMFAILFIPSLREIFSIVKLPAQNIFEVIILVLSPIVIVEIFKFLKINTLKEKE